jgi:hypothetical protein
MNLMIQKMMKCLDRSVETEREGINYNHTETLHVHSFRTSWAVE